MHVAGRGRQVMQHNVQRAQAAQPVDVAEVNGFPAVPFVR